MLYRHCQLLCDGTLATLEYTSQANIWRRDRAHVCEDGEPLKAWSPSRLLNDASRLWDDPPQLQCNAMLLQASLEPGNAITPSFLAKQDILNQVLRKEYRIVRTCGYGNQRDVNQSNFTSRETSFKAWTSENTEKWQVSSFTSYKKPLLWRTTKVQRASDNVETRGRVQHRRRLRRETHYDITKSASRLKAVVCLQARSTLPILAGDDARRLIAPHSADSAATRDLQHLFEGPRFSSIYLD